MIYVKALAASVLLSACLVANGPASAQGDAGQPQRLQAITLTAGMHNIRAEVALTPEQRQKGLMFRRDLGSHKACCSSSTHRHRSASG